MKLKTMLSIAIVFVVGLASTGIAQSPKKEKPRRIKYIAGNSSGNNVDSSGKVIRKKSIALERSELADNAENDLLEKEAFDLINLKRMERGLPSLAWNQSLSNLARKHSENMALFGFFSHTGVNGRLVDERAADKGINYWNAIGENIAFNQGIENPTSFAVERWMMSEGHKRNLLDGMWKESGLGIAVTKDGKYFFTQIFIVRK